MIEDYESYQIVLYCSIFLLSNSLFFVNFTKSANFAFVYASICAVLVGCIFGIRSDNIGLDSKNYADFFEGSHIIEGSPGFVLLAIFFRLFASDYGVFFIVISVLSNVFMVVGLRHISKNYVFVYGLILTSFTFLNMNINIIRQGLAVSLMIFSVGMILADRRKLSIFITLLAASIHPTAILMAANVFLVNREISSRAKFFLFVTVFFLYVFSVMDLINLIASVSDALKRYVWYFYWDIANPWKIKHVYYGVFLLLGLLFFFSRRVSWEAHRVLAYVLYGVVLLLAFKSEEMVADRVFLYFMPMIPVLMYYAVTRFNPKILAVGALVVMSNLWLLKTMFYQYPGWFIPPFESVRL